MMRRALVVGGLMLTLAGANWAIWQKERVLATGTSMLLALAPVDPRSLMQGDYMRLDYAIARALQVQKGWPRDGLLVVVLDTSGVAKFVRRHDAGVPLTSGERLLRYRSRDGLVRVGANAFYFEEGDADRYSRARYGELRVDERGTSVLVGLRDDRGAPLR